MQLGRTLLIFWENFSQVIKSHLSNLLENLGPGGDPYESHDTFFHFGAVGSDLGFTYLSTMNCLH